MGYDLTPRKKGVEPFHFGAFSFPVLLEACGYLWPCIHNAGRWYCAFGIDPRMPQGDDYPALLSNVGFPVTAEEARMLARVARNIVAIQRLVPDDHATEDMRSKASFRKEDVEALLIRAMGGGSPDPWPVKMRTDFVDLFEKFAPWAERSGGFTIG